MARQSLRPSVRFEVFKRDDFACAYCGSKPPSVTLEVDHLVPVAEGGTNDFDNLITACWECNRGKGARPLSDVQEAVDLEERAAKIKERELQMRAYNEAMEEKRKRLDEENARCIDYWFDLWDMEKLYLDQLPNETALRWQIEKVGVHEVLRAMDITRRKFSYPRKDAPKYFGGVIRSIINESERGDV